MSRGFISFGAGGPRIGVVLGRRDMGRFVAALAIPFGVLALFGVCTEHAGGVMGTIAASIVVAMLWRAWTLPPHDPRKDAPARFHDD
jgi:hypothetical protein